MLHPRPPAFSGNGNLGILEIEICVDSVESAIAADRGGAQRIELCSALSEGGITPSAGLIGAVRSAVSLDVFVIIRPRGGDFVYSEHQFGVMQQDIVTAKALGVHGVALGVLTADGRVDVARTRALVELARPLQVTFHRAFDLSLDLDRALEEVISTGASRLLTSGGERDAIQGKQQISRFCLAAKGRIGIVAGAGIRQSNVRQLVLSTGVLQVHTSLTSRTGSGVPNGNHRVRIGSGSSDLARYLVKEQDVRRFKKTMEKARMDALAGFQVR